MRCKRMKMETVPFSDFAKLDLRVAKIISVERVEGSEKLYKLTVSLGAEERTLAAGLAAHYAPDELVGRKIVVVANLESRMLRGIESRGMLLAADDGERVSLLQPDKDLAEGSKVR